MPRNAIRWSKEQLHYPRPVHRVPSLFGRGGRERVLLCLSANGPMYGRQIERLLNIQEREVRYIVQDLQDLGLVVKRTRQIKYVDLNRRLPYFNALYELLIAMDRCWPVPRVQERYECGGMPYGRKSRATEIFQSRVRSRALLFIAAMGETDMRAIRTVAGLSPISSLLAVNHWERERIVRSAMRGNERIVSLDPTFECADELRALLDEIVRRDAWFRRLRAKGGISACQGPKCANAASSRRSSAASRVHGSSLCLPSKVR